MTLNALLRVCASCFNIVSNICNAFFLYFFLSVMANKRGDNLGKLLVTIPYSLRDGGLAG